MPRQVAVSSGYGSLPNGNFIPEIWSMKMQAKFYARSVVPAIANHDQSGRFLE